MYRADVCVYVCVCVCVCVWYPFLCTCVNVYAHVCTLDEGQCQLNFGCGRYILHNMHTHVFEY